MNDSLTYRDAGVDLDAADRAKRSLGPLLDAASDENTLSGLGAFGGLYAVPRGLSEPVLVSSADGVGTKLKVAFLTGRHDTVGRDLVNHCVNDILVQGARPLFFLDYLAIGEMDEGVVSEVVGGVAAACREKRVRAARAARPRRCRTSTRRASTTWPASWSAWWNAPGSWTVPRCVPATG